MPPRISANSLAGPSLHHLLGTDQLGRDLLSRAIYGARTTMLIAIGATLLGADHRHSDRDGERVVRRHRSTSSTSGPFEVFTMVPQILMALLLIALFGGGVLKLRCSSE